MEPNSKIKKLAENIRKFKEEVAREKLLLESGKVPVEEIKKLQAILSEGFEKQLQNKTNFDQLIQEITSSQVQHSSKVDKLVKAFQEIKFDFPKITDFHEHITKPLQENLKALAPKEEEDYIFIIDKYSSKVTYIGYAKPGATENQPVWKIRRLTTDKDTVFCEYADSDTEFDNVWNKRDKLTYG